MSSINSITLSAAAAALALLATTACSPGASDPGEEQNPSETSQSSESSAQYPSFEESAAELDEEVVEMVNNSMFADELDTSMEEWEIQQLVAETYVEARAETGDPILAEARIASIYSQELLEKRASLWVKQTQSDESSQDFLDVHEASGAEELDISPIAGGVQLVWDVELDEECGAAAATVTYEEHWAWMDIQVDQDEAGVVTVTEFSHQLGCGCGQCVQSV